MTKSIYQEKLLTLFITFSKIGAFTFGGGYAMIPLMEREVVENHQWLTEEEILNMFAIAESTPGVISVNTATFVGYRVAGFWGSVVATLGVVIPSFLVILGLLLIYFQFKENRWVEYAFGGIRLGVLVLIANAFFKFCKKAERSWLVYFLATVAFIGTIYWKISAVWLLLFGLFCGLWFGRNSLQDKR